MPRTWTLSATLTLTGSHTLQSMSNVVTDGAGNAYFWTRDADTAGELRVWKWDGSTVTDISGTTFRSAQYGTSNYPRYFGIKLCWFDGDLYFAWNSKEDAGSFDQEGFVHKYSGSGQSWSLDYTFVDDGALAVGFIQSSTTANRDSHPFDGDSNRLVAVGHQRFSTGMRMASKAAGGGSWTLQTMPTSNYTEPFESVVGDNKNNDRPGLLAMDEPSGATFRVIEYDTPDWSNLSASNIGARYLIGYADGKSFFVVDNGADFDLYYSTDWGVNITSANLTLSNNSYRLANCFNNLASNAVMLARKATTQAYTWNTSTNQFDADGTTGQDIDGGFFVLSSVLYALCASTGSGEVRVYGDGAVAGSSPTGTAAQFYFGQGALKNKFDLPWSGVNPKSLTLDKSLGVAVMGTNAPDGQPVIYSTYPYATGVNSSLEFPTGVAISALRWV